MALKITVTHPRLSVIADGLTWPAREQAAPFLYMSMCVWARILFPKEIQWH
jgi:hypothetical protein